MVEIIEHLKNQQEDKILQDLLKEKFVIKWEAFVKKIATNIFIVGNNKTKNVWYFCDKKWKVFFNLKSIREIPNFQWAQIESWYWEKKNKKGENEMYRIKSIDLEWLFTYKPKLWEKIGKYSLEYFEAWKYISFAEDRLEIKSTILKSKEKNSYAISPTRWVLLSNKNAYFFVQSEEIVIWSHSWAIRTRDLIKFYQQWQLTDKETLEKIKAKNIEGEEREKIIAETNERFFWKSVKLLEKIVLEQIWDPKFARVNDDVTIEEINSYYWYGYDKKTWKYISINEDKDIMTKIMSWKIKYKILRYG